MQVAFNLLLPLLLPVTFLDLKFWHCGDTMFFFFIVSVCLGFPAFLVRKFWSNSILLTSVLNTSCTQGWSGALSELAVKISEKTPETLQVSSELCWPHTTDNFLIHKLQHQPAAYSGAHLQFPYILCWYRCSWNGPSLPLEMREQGLTSALTSLAGNLLCCPAVQHLISGVPTLTRVGLLILL